VSKGTASMRSRKAGVVQITTAARARARVLGAVRVQRHHAPRWIGTELNRDYQPDASRAPPSTLAAGLVRFGDEAIIDGVRSCCLSPTLCRVSKESPHHIVVVGVPGGWRCGVALVSLTSDGTGVLCGAKNPGPIGNTTASALGPGSCYARPGHEFH